MKTKINVDTLVSILLILQEYCCVRLLLLYISYILLQNVSKYLPDYLLTYQKVAVLIIILEWTSYFTSANYLIDVWLSWTFLQAYSVKHVLECVSWHSDERLIQQDGWNCLMRRQSVQVTCGSHISSVFETHMHTHSLRCGTEEISFSI
jgi:DNA-directed RNA polymerase subunit N (RpoN/RPB10)